MDRESMEEAFRIVQQNTNDGLYFRGGFSTQQGWYRNEPDPIRKIKQATISFFRTASCTVYGNFAQLLKGYATYDLSPSDSSTIHSVHVRLERPLHLDLDEFRRALRFSWCETVHDLITVRDDGGTDFSVQPLSDSDDGFNSTILRDYSEDTFNLIFISYGKQYLDLS